MCVFCASDIYMSLISLLCSGILSIYKADNKRAESAANPYVKKHMASVQYVHCTHVQCTLLGCGRTGSCRRELSTTHSYHGRENSYLQLSVQKGKHLPTILFSDE